MLVEQLLPSSPEVVEEAVEEEGEEVF